MITIPDTMRRPAEIERDELKKQLAGARAEVEHWKGECSDLVRMAHEMRAEIDYFQTLIDLQHKRTLEANKLWQKAHNKPDVLPDLGKLVEWLLLRLQNQETIIEANRATVKAKDALIEALRMGKMSPCDYYTSKESEENLYRDLAEVRADLRLAKNIIETHVERVAERDKLIEQMREALNILVASATPSGPLWHGSAEMKIARAALSAAERI